MPPALGAWSLNHWTTREVPLSYAFIKIYRISAKLLLYIYTERERERENQDILFVWFYMNTEKITFNSWIA